MDNLIDQQESANYQLTPQAIKFMRRSTGWMIFLAVIGFIFSTLLLIGGVAIMTNALFGPLMGASYIVIAVAGFFINLFWLRSAIHFRSFAAEGNHADAENAFINFNSCVIFSSITILLYIILIAVVISTGVAGELLLQGPEL